MIRIATSIVGKLWGTILLLVSFVLFIFTIFMLEFLENYHNEQSEASLRQTAAAIASIIDEEEIDDKQFAIISELLTETTNVLIAKNSDEILYARQEGINKEEIQQKIISSKAFEEVYASSEPIVEELKLPSNREEDASDTNYIVLGFPLKSVEDLHGAVFIYKNPDALHQTSNETTKIVVIAAAIAFILTTIFAFFLSSKITLPLRKMREHAFELAKGRFDSKIETKQNDEIGQLAVAFNQMGRQLKHHLEVINQEKEQLSSILTSMTDSVITFNRDKTILVSNPPAERLLQKWFVEKGLDSSKPIPDELYQMLDHVLNFEDQLDEEFEMGKSYYSITISPLYSRDSIRGAVAVIRDKTEETKLEKLKSDFIANVSHELRTPIAMLQGYSEAIIDGVVTTEEERIDMIRVIYDESQRMSRLVTDLLDLARMESGHMTLYKEEVPLVTVIERMTHKFDQTAKEKHVQLQIETDFSDETLISIDEDRIEQVLTNLIDNAIRHTPADGSVTVSMINEQNYAKIQVSDTGQGIPQDDLPYVFERFYKADKARTRSKGGTGLGLAITKNIVEAHNGRISVDSVEQQGTTFTFYLPLP